MDNQAINAVNFQTDNVNKRYSARKIFILLFLIILIIISNIISYSFGQKNTSTIIVDLIPTPTSYIPPTLTPTLITLPSITPSPVEVNKTILNMCDDFQKNDYPIKICGYPKVNLPEPAMTDKECLLFSTTGEIEYTLNDKTENLVLDQAKKEEIAQIVNSIYDELLSNKFVDWFKKINVPMVGGTPQSITIYSRCSSINSPLSGQLLETSFVRGADFSEESQRLIDIYNTLIQFAP